MKNLKDRISTICAILLALCGAVVAMQQAGVVVPSTILTITGVVAALSTAVIGYLTGKKPDGTAKKIDPNTGKEIE